MPFKPPKQVRESAPSAALSHDKKRDRDNEWRGWYKTKRWQRLRWSILVRDRFTCQQTGIMLIGKYPAHNSPVVDHIKAHRGDETLFWDEGNLQAISKAFHDREKQSQERADTTPPSHL